MMNMLVKYVPVSLIDHVELTLYWLDSAGHQIILGSSVSVCMLLTTMKTPCRHHPLTASFVTEIQSARLQLTHWIYCSLLIVFGLLQTHLNKYLRCTKFPLANETIPFFDISIEWSWETTCFCQIQIWIPQLKLRLQLFPMLRVMVENIVFGAKVITCGFIRYMFLSGSV